MPLFTRLLIFLSLMVSASCSRVSPEIVIAGPTMGTTYSIKVVAPVGDISAHELRQVIEASLRRVDEAMSGYREDSEISRFNALDSTDWFDVSAELAQVITASLEVSAASGGAFDVTVTPVVKAWGFGASDGPPTALPDELTLAELRKRVGYEKLHARMSPPALRKDESGLTVDLNAIAPGFAVDLIAAHLEGRGIENFMIDVGGEIRARGRNAKGDRWRIAVESPIQPESAPVAVIGLDDAALATSGEYRNGYWREGVRYSHTIDPRTAYPIESSAASVVVIHRQAMYADAWATAMNVLGRQAGLDLAERLNMPSMFVVENGDQLAIEASEGMRPFIVAND